MKCTVCGRKLRDAASIARGMGPVCAGKAKNGSKGKRHLLISGPAANGNGRSRASAPAGDFVPLANGEPMSTDEALAVLRRIVKERPL